MSLLFTSVNGGLLVLIWLVQIIIYPGMHGWDRARFVQLHESYCLRMSFIVGPLMLTQAVLGLWQAGSEPGPIPFLQVGLMIFTWGVTGFVSVPLHRRLRDGYHSDAVSRLVNTNWLRTSGWSLICLLDWLR